MPYKLKKLTAFIFFMQDVLSVPPELFHCGNNTSDIQNSSHMQIYLQIFQKNSKKTQRRHLKSCRIVYCKSIHSKSNFWGYFSNRLLTFCRAYMKVSSAEILTYILKYTSLCKMLYVMEVSMNHLCTCNYFLSIVLVLAGTELNFFIMCGAMLWIHAGKCW